MRKLVWVSVMWWVVFFSLHLALRVLGDFQPSAEQVDAWILLRGGLAFMQLVVLALAPVVFFAWAGWFLWCALKTRTPRQDVRDLPLESLTPGQIRDIHEAERRHWIA